MTSPSQCIIAIKICLKYTQCNSIHVKNTYARIKTTFLGAGEMAQQLRALAAPAEDLGGFQYPHQMTLNTCDPSSRASNALICSPWTWHTCGACVEK